MRAAEGPRGGEPGLKKLLAAQRRRFGYRRLHVLVARQKIRLNHKRLFRVYRDERRRMRRHDGRKRPGGTRAPLVLPKQLNHWWCLDFVSDALRRLSTLTVVYDFIRERLVRISDTPLSAARVVREFDRFAAQRGYPGMIVSDNGMTSHAVLRWQQEHGV